MIELNKKQESLLVQNPVNITWKHYEDSYPFHGTFIGRPYEGGECSWVFHSKFSHSAMKKGYEPLSRFIALFHRKAP